MPASPWRPPPTPIESRLPRWQRIGIPFLIFVASFAFYQYEVGQPPQIIFDEAHYVKVARNYTNGVLLDPKWTDAARPQNFEHPPVGKYLIALGIWLNGNPNNAFITADDPGEANQAYVDANKPNNVCGHHNPECADDARGWRLFPSLVGASGVAAAYLISLRLFRSVPAGVASAVLLLADGMYYLHSRVAMLDIFAAAFSLWAFAYALSPTRRGPWLSATFLGLAIASKYNALFLLPFLFLVHFLRTPPPRYREPAHSEGARDRFLNPWNATRPWLQRGGRAVAWSVLLPILVFAATYFPYFQIWYQLGGLGHAAQQWAFVQVKAFTWDFAGEATHSYWSAPGTWIPMIRPVWYYNYDPGTGLVEKIYSVGNPLLWWTATAAALVLLVRVLIRLVRNHRQTFLRWEFLERLVYYPFPLGRDLAFGMGLLFLAFLFLPWFALQRISFIYYMTAVVPAFSVLAGGLVGEAWDAKGRRRILAVAYVALVVLTFAVYFPVVMGLPIEGGHFRFIMRLVPWMRT